MMGLVVAAGVALVGCSSGGTPEDGESSSSSSAATEQPAAGIQAPIEGTLYFTRTTGGDVQAIFAATGTSEQQVTAPGKACCILRASPTDAVLLVMPGNIVPPIIGGTVPVAGGQFERLVTADPTLNVVPGAWSPDGTRIAFEGWDDADPSRTGMYTARVSDGGELVRVTARPGELHDVPLDYSPDGSQIVFYRSAHPDPDPHTDGSLWVVDADGTGEHQISTAETPPADWARWSPDGSRIVFASERLSSTGPIWTVRPDGSELTTLFQDDEGRFAIAPDWSPDGERIAFALDPSDDQFLHESNSVYTITSTGSDLTLISDTNDFKSQLEWVE